MDTLNIFRIAFTVTDSFFVCLNSMVLYAIWTGRWEMNRKSLINASVILIVFIIWLIARIVDWILQTELSDFIGNQVLSYFPLLLVFMYSTRVFKSVSSNSVEKTLEIVKYLRAIAIFLLICVEVLIGVTFWIDDVPDVVTSIRYAFTAIFAAYIMFFEWYVLYLFSTVYKNLSQEKKIILNSPENTARLFKAKCCMIGLILLRIKDDSNSKPCKGAGENHQYI